MNQDPKDIIREIFGQAPPSIAERLDALDERLDLWDARLERIDRNLQTLVDSLVDPGEPEEGDDHAGARTLDGEEMGGERNQSEPL